MGHNLETQNTPDKLAQGPSSLRLMGYSSGNFGKAILAHIVDTFFIFYLTDLLGIRPSVAGALILFSYATNILVETFVGYAADRTHAKRLGKFGPYILFGSPLCAMSFIALFSIPFFKPSPDFMPILVLLLLILFRASYSLIDIPHNALLARIKSDSRRQSTIVVMRFFFSSVASFCMAITTHWIFQDKSIVVQMENFQTFAFLAAIASTIVMVISWWSVKQDDISNANLAPIPISLFRGISILFSDRNVMLIAATALSTTLLIPFFAKGLNYYAKYYLGDESLIGGLFVTLVSAQIVITVIFSRIAHNISKPKLLAWSHIVAAIGFCLFFLSTSMGLSPVTYIAIAVIGFGLAGVYSIIWAILPDLIDEIQTTIGIRVEAIMFSLIVMLMKIGIGMGTSLFGFTIDIIGYSANTAQPPETLQALVWVITGAPALGAGICLLLIRTYMYRTSR